MDRQAFQERFKLRAECFLSAIGAMCADKSISWRVCNCDPEVDENGFVTMIAKVVSPDRVDNDKKALLDYCNLLINQGFMVELIIQWSVVHLSLMVTSWESEGEPDWDVSIRSDFVLKWRGVKGPGDLGL